MCLWHSQWSMIPVLSLTLYQTNQNIFSTYQQHIHIYPFHFNFYLQKFVHQMRIQCLFMLSIRFLPDTFLRKKKSFIFFRFTTKPTYSNGNLSFLHTLFLYSSFVCFVFVYEFFCHSPRLLFVFSHNIFHSKKYL